MKGAEETKGMRARLGRGVYIGGDGWKGVPDAGAWGLSVFLEGLVGGGVSKVGEGEADGGFELV